MDAFMVEGMSPLETLIRDEIRARGPMSLARFMELALYHPDHGYYARADAVTHIGRSGDFFTSVSVGPLFGRLLARQFARWWNEMERPEPFHLIECGGLDGQLAADILTALRTDSPPCFEVTHYSLVEPLPRLAEIQRKRLAEFPRVTVASSLKSLPGLLPLRSLPSTSGAQAPPPVTQNVDTGGGACVPPSIPGSISSKDRNVPNGWPRPPNGTQGILFANELLDAFPVHRLEKVNGQWMECVITLSGDALTWTHAPCPPAWIRDFPANLTGQVECGPYAIEWLREAAAALKSGRILFLDYGWTDEEYFQVERPHGTIRAYRKHRLVENLLADPGQQDLTAHVRWTPILQEADSLGFLVEEFIQQGRWLTRGLAEQPFEMTPTEIRQFQTLSHPDLMGIPFRALVLARG